MKSMRGFQKILLELKEVVKSHRPGDTLTPPTAMSSIEIHGYRLSYVAAGVDNPEVPPVVLLHGFGGFFMDWPRVMAPLAKVTKVYAVDLPGWGFSEHNPSAKALEDEVKVVGAFLHKLGLKNVTLCGLSYGAGVVWAAASLHLARVARAVLLNPMPPHPLRYLHSSIYRSIFFLNSFRFANRLSHRLLTKSQYKLICRENLLNDRLLDSFYLDLAFMVIKQPKMPEIIYRHAVGAKTVDWNAWEHHLSGIRIPIRILQGENDRIFSMSSAQYLHNLIPNSKLESVPQCGHAMVFDQHKRVSDLILQDLHSKESNERLQKDFRKIKN